MGKIDHHLPLLLAFASARSHNGQYEPLVSEGANAGVIFALTFLEGQAQHTFVRCRYSTTQELTLLSPLLHFSNVVLTEYRVAEMPNRSSKRYSALATPGVVVGFTGAVLPRLLEPRCQDMNNGPPDAGHGRSECTCML